jgi:hypothetical protein
VLDSVLLLLSVTAGILLVPAFVALLGVEKHRHVAQSQDSNRRARVAVAATLVGLGGLATAAVLDGDPVPALAAAVVLSVSVLVWSPLSSSWAVRGVVVWALLVTAVLAFQGWLLQEIWVSSMSTGERVASLAGWLLLLLAVARLQHYVRPVIGAQAGLVPGAAVAQHIPILRPVLSLAALVAASGVVVAVTTEDTGPGEEGRSPQAGLTGRSQTVTGPTAPQPSPAATPSATPSATRTLGPGVGLGVGGPGAGDGVTTVAGLGGDIVAGVSSVRPATILVPPGKSCPTTGPARPGADGKDGGPKPSAGVRPGTGGGTKAPTSGGTPKGPGPSRPTGGPGTGTPATSGPGTSTPIPAPGRTLPPPSSEPAPPMVTNPDAQPSPVVTAIGRALGHQKDKPNRPEKPGKGNGRDHNAPTVYPVPSSPQPVEPAPVPAEPVPVAEPTDDKTYGYEKEKPNRPAGAPSPGHGRPSVS